MELEKWFASMSAEQRELMLGRASEDPLRKTFDGKRTVHAGLKGRLTAPGEAQKIWTGLMRQAPVRGLRQAAYIHIPFCQTKCLYCGFFQNQSEQAAEDQYVSHLVRELEAASECPRIADGLIHAVFMGGGTPTSLSPANMKKLLKAIRTNLPLSNDCEWTLEGRIHDVVPEKLEVWMNGGINRVSLGVQSFHTRIRQQLGRIDSGETVRQRIAELKSWGQCAVIVDLIYGLPDQTMRIWQEDLDMLEEADVDGMDLYQLNVYEGCDLDRRIREGRMPPAASTEEQADMYAAAVDFVSRRAFHPLSIRHWSRGSRERNMYNTMAKEGVTLFPFGSGAGGHVDGYSMMLHRFLKPYEAMVDQHQKPFMGLLKQSSLQPVVNIIMHQMEQGYFNLIAVKKMDQRMGDLKWLFDLWQDRGLVRYNGVSYCLTEAGEFWQVNVAQTVLECVQKLAGQELPPVVQRIAAQNHPSARRRTDRGSPLLHSGH